MNKASPTDLRKCAQLASALIRAGIEFVPVIVTDQQQKNRLLEKLEQGLDAAMSEAHDLERTEK